MSDRTLLLLGGSRQQVVAIEAAKKCGYRTVLCDYLPDNPGQHVADTFYQVSTTNPNAVLDVARREGASGVLAYASDPAAPTAAYVAEALGLPTNPFESVMALSEKHRFRQHLSQAGLPCPRFFSLHTDDDPAEVARRTTGLGFPVVIKPTDSSGSKGVTVIQAPNTAPIGRAINHARGFSRNGVLICEEYIDRTFERVIGGDIFVIDGAIVFWGIMSCLRDQASCLVPVGERMPAGLTPTQYCAVQSVLQRLVSSLGIRFGELNVEIIMGQDDTPYVLELGARAGGNMIPVQLSDLSGIDLVTANVCCAMGDDPGDLHWDCQNFPGAYTTYVLHSLQEGAFDSLDVDEDLARHVYRTVMYANPGDAVQRMDGANKALGILFLRFDSVAQMESALVDIDSRIKAVVR